MAEAERLCLLGLVNHKTPTSPRFFVSVDSKRFSHCVTRLESTVAGSFVNVDSKRLVYTKIVQSAVCLASVACKRVRRKKKASRKCWRHGIKSRYYSRGIVQEK